MGLFDSDLIENDKNMLVVAVIDYLKDNYELIMDRIKSFNEWTRIPRPIIYDEVLLMEQVSKCEVVDGKLILDFPHTIVRLKNEYVPITNGLFMWKRTSSFRCDYNTAISDLCGGPEEVLGNFICRRSNIKSLKGGPKLVGGNLDCSYCINLENIDDCPEKIGGKFIITHAAF